MAEFLKWLSGGGILTIIIWLLERPEHYDRIKAIISWPATHEQAMEGAKLIPDELPESLGCYGDEDNVRARLRDYRDAGITTPIVPDATKKTVDFLARGGW